MKALDVFQEGGWPSPDPSALGMGILSFMGVSGLLVGAERWRGCDAKHRSVVGHLPGSVRGEEATKHWGCKELVSSRGPQPKRQQA